MVFMKETKETKKMNVKPFLLPVYIVLSLLFIVWSAYSYIGQFVAGQAFQNGQNAAVNQMITEIQQASQDCSKTIPVGQVELINVACLQQSEQPAQAPEAAAQ